MAKTKAAAKPKPEPVIIDSSKVYLCIWKDATGTPKAYGAHADKKIARKIADKARDKYEKANTIDLTTFEIFSIPLNPDKA